MVEHSIGEVATAHVVGALSLSQTVDVVYHRSRLQERAWRQGGMVADRQLVVALLPERPMTGAGR